MTDLRPNLDDPDNDPFLWLEDVEGTAATAWADAQSQITMARLCDSRFAADRDELWRLLDRPDNLPQPTRRGGLLYNFWQDADHPRGIWRRTTLASYRTTAPDWDILLDLDALAVLEGEDWIWQGAATLPPTHAHAILRLSRGGSDAVVLREFDLVARAFVMDGFVLPEAKGGVAWLDQETLLLSTSLGGATSSGYSSTVRLWQRGTAWSDGPVLFRTKTASMSAWGGFDRQANRLIFAERTSSFDAQIWIGDRGGPKQLVDLPTDAWADWEGDWLAVRGRTAWTAGTATFQPDEVVVIRLQDFLTGDRGFTKVFDPGPRLALQGFFWADGQLVLSVLDDLRPVYLMLAPGAWHPIPLAGLPPTGTVSAWRLDHEAEESDGSLLAIAQDPITPPTLWLTGAAFPTPEILKRLPPAFDATGVVVTCHEAISSDGERIPYVMCGPPDQTGEAPVHMTAYGGFGISSLPNYRIAIGKLWLERGGTTVLANIRGGGEFGTRWHEAGRFAGKRLSHDDFAAVAADLVQRGVTRPDRIAAEGASNGGLLIARARSR